MKIIEQFDGIRQLLIREVGEESSDNRTFIYRGVTETVAADGGILRVSGADFSRFDDNPMVLADHREEIGRVVKYEVNKKERAIDFHVELMPPGVSELADSIARKINAGFSRAASIGFQVRSFEELSRDDRHKLGLGPYGWAANDWEPHELSILTQVGSDPKALKRALKDGAILESDLDMEPKTDPAAEAQVAKDKSSYRFKVDEPLDGEWFTVEQDSSDAHTEALEANTEEQRRTQVALAEVAQELSGLRNFLAKGEDDKGAESEVGHEPDTSVAEADEDDDLLRAIDDLRERVSNKGNRDERQGTGEA